MRHYGLRLRRAGFESQVLNAQFNFKKSTSTASIETRALMPNGEQSPPGGDTDPG